MLANRPSGTDNLPVCDVDGVVPSGNVGKCLGYSWNGNLKSSKSIEETSPKLEGLSSTSIGVFSGDITSLPSRSV